MNSSSRCGKGYRQHQQILLKHKAWLQHLVSRNFWGLTSTQPPKDQDPAHDPTLQGARVPRTAWQSTKMCLFIEKACLLNKRTDSESYVEGEAIREIRRHLLTTASRRGLRGMNVTRRGAIPQPWNFQEML
jgi:hypothetical protein